MDDGQFDDVAKLIGSVKNRRQTLRTLGLGLLGAAGLGAALEAEAKGKRKAAGKGKHKKHKKHGSTRSAVACTPVVTNTGGQANPTCADIGQSGASLKVDPPVSGSQTVTVGDCSCKITYTVSSDGKSLSFQSDFCRVAKVIVKGGSEGANIFDYTGCSGGGASSGSGLTNPTNQGLSHFIFCGITCCKPKTCAELGYECGNPTGACGETLDCGDCTECPNSYCDDAFQCQCNPDTCKSLGKQCGVWDNGCCDTVDCGECTECANSYCDKAGQCQCTQTPKDEACQGHCGESVDDGCCGTYTCDACCTPITCTIGHYKNQCSNAAYLKNTAFPCTTGPSAFCASKYPTLATAVAARGNDVICAQVATAYLNLRLNQYCGGIDPAQLCTYSNSQLDAFNNSGDAGCPHDYCG